MATTPDYTILNAPRITAAGFAAILRVATSPAAGEAAACYKAFAAAGVDPAVGLAIFRKESTFGRFGRAASNHSWGNLRGGKTYPLDGGGFRIYPSWTVGAADAARLLVIYGHNQIRPGTNTSTVQTFPYVWAPAADGNAPDLYGDSLANWIRGWSALYPVRNPPRATAIAHATGLHALYTIVAGRPVTKTYQRGFVFTAYVADSVYLPATHTHLREILTGTHAGLYVHPGEPGLAIGPLPAA